MDELPGGTTPTDADSPPHWLWVAVVVGIAAGVSSVALGIVVAWVGDLFRPGVDDFGWGHYWAVSLAGIFAAPVCAAGGALVGGLTAGHAARMNAYTRRQIWKRSFGFGLLSLSLSGLTILATIFR